MSLIYQSPDHRVHGRRPGIYLGGKSDAKNKQKLLDRHITHILNVTPPKEVSIQAGVPNYFEKPGSICHRTNDAPSFSSAAAETCFTYRRIAVYDSSTSVPALLDAAEEICSFIATALCHGSVLVHCQRGVSRSVAALAFYLIRRVGMTLDDAMSLIQRRRPEADPVPAFREMLRKYAIQHPPRCSDGTDDSVTQNGKSLLVREERQGAIVGPLMPSRPDEVDQSQEKRKRVEMIGPSRGPATSESIFESVILPESSVVGPSMPIIPIGANQPKDKRRKVEMTGPARAPATSDTSSDSTKLLESSM